MYSIEKLLEMLSRNKASDRYEACEWLRVSQESSPEVVRALMRAASDANKEVAERAKYALQADVHHQMAIKMGIIKPDHAMGIPYLPNNNMTMAGKSRLAEKNSDNHLALLFFGIIFALIGVGLLLKAFSTQGLIDRSKSWPFTQGEVIFSEIKYLPPSEWSGGGYEPKITYQYSVSGTKFSCLMRLGSVSTKSEAISIQQTYQVGSKINVRYDPERPQVCASAYDSVPMGTWCVSIVFFAVGSFCAINSLQSIIRKKKNNEDGATISS